MIWRHGLNCLKKNLTPILFYCIIIIALVELKNNENNKRFNINPDTFYPVNHPAKSMDGNGAWEIWTHPPTDFLTRFALSSSPLATRRISVRNLCDYFVHVTILILSWTQRPRELILFWIKNRQTKEYKQQYGFPEIYMKIVQMFKNVRVKLWYPGN